MGKSDIKRVLGSVRRADEKYGMIQDGDKIAVGVSGGKDSLMLLFALSIYKKFSKKNFELFAVTVALGFEPLRIKRLDDAKHIFTHIEWHMIAYSVRISSDFDGFDGAGGTLLVSNERLHAEYAIPSAFSAYTKYL